METIRELIRRAHEEHRVLRIAYRKDKKKDAISRDIHVYAYGEWYVEAHCLLREDHRRFRIDRIEDAELLDERFTPDRYFSELARRHGWQDKAPSKIHRELEVDSHDELSADRAIPEPDEISNYIENPVQHFQPSKAGADFSESCQYPGYLCTPLAPTSAKPATVAKIPSRSIRWSRVAFRIMLVALISPLLYFFCFSVPLLQCDFCSGVSYLTTRDIDVNSQHGNVEEKVIWLCSRCDGHGTISLGVRFLAGQPQDDLTPDRQPIPHHIADHVLKQRMQKP